MDDSTGRHSLRRSLVHAVFNPFAMNDMCGEIDLAVPPDVVWAHLVDPRVLAHCIPGCVSMTRLADDRYACHLQIRYGLVKAGFDTVLTLSDVAAPRSYTLTGRGQGGLAGMGEGSAAVVLESTGGGTRLRYRARLSAGGHIGEFGSRWMNAMARKLTARFFATFAAVVAGSEASVAEPAFSRPAAGSDGDPA